MLKLKQTRWLLPALLVTMTLIGGNAYTAGSVFAQEPSTPTVEPSPPGQRSISEAKRRLIYQLLELTGGEQMYEQTQQALFAQTQQQIESLIGQTLEGREGVSPAEAAEIRSNVNTLIAQVSEAVQSVTYDEMLEQVYYPVYDQYFSEADLQGLIAFYQTPLGEKLAAVSPEIVQTSTQLSTEIYLPRILDVMNQTLQAPTK